MAQRLSAVSQYLVQQVNYGGEWVTIGWLITELGDSTAGMWLAGYKSGGGEIREV